MGARGLLLALSLIGGCGEIREVPVEPGQDETSVGEPGTDDSTSLMPSSDGTDDGDTTGDPPDLDTESTTAATDTGDEPDVVWASFCSPFTMAKAPGDEVVIEIPVEEVEVRSDFRIGMRIHEAQAGLRATVTFNEQEVVLLDEPECGHDITASFTDAGKYDLSFACDPGLLDEERTLVPLEPLAPLIDGDIAGTWQLRFRSKSSTDILLVVAQACVFVATPA